jgi:hypothetical protein
MAGASETSRILYLRQDLVWRYADERDLEAGLIVWGDRQVYSGRVGVMSESFRRAIREREHPPPYLVIG